jgi:lysophospholipase L1-like esterase
MPRERRSKYGNDAVDNAQLASSLAQKATKIELQAVASGSPKGTYATLSALQTAFPTGNTNIYLVTADGKWYYWNGSAWTVGGTYQATGLSDGMVKPEKTNFVINKPINLFNKETALIDYYISTGSSGAALPFTDYAASDFIPVQAGKTYISTNYGNMAFFDSSKVFISGLQNSTTTAPANAAYIRVTMRKANVNTEMFVEGSVLPSSYIGFYDNVELGINVKTKKENLPTGQFVDKTNVDFIVKEIGVNKFDKSTFTLDKAINKDNGTLYTYVGLSATGFIEVKSNTVYTSKRAANGAWFDENKIYISGFTAISNTTSPVNAKYVRYSFVNGKETDEMLVEGATLPVVYVTYEENYVSQTKIYAENVIGLGNVNSKWKGKIWNALGDSITNGYSFTPYHSYCQADLEFATVRNYGISQSTIAKKDVGDTTNSFALRYVNMDNNADLVTVMGGVNDEGWLVPLGTNSDTTVETFYGACNVLFSGLIEKYPTKKLALFVQLPRQNHKNGQKAYVQAYKEVAEKYSIPYLDLFIGSNINPDSQQHRDLYIADGIHPNNTGHRRIADRISAFLETL